MAGCTSGGKPAEKSDPTRGTAATLVAALQQHTLSGVPLSDPTAADSFTQAVAAVDDTQVQVTSGTAEIVDATATVPLTWRWSIDSEHVWTYRTSVRMEQRDGSWLVDWTPEALVPDLGAEEVLDFSRSMPQRADVLGAGGRPLVTQRPVVRYGLDKVALGKRPVGPAARRIAAAVDIRPGPYVKLAKAAGERAFVEAIVLRADTAWQRVDSDFAEIPGARAVEDSLPLAPTPEFAAPILGRVGPATAEVVEKSEGRIRPGDEVGLSGLQARYDERLAGTATTSVTAIPTCDGLPCPEGEPRVLEEWPGTSPKPLRVTLDERLQARAENALATLPADAGATALVAVKPSTGAILAAANGAGSGGTNVATFGQYAPGSTFKIVTALALARAGKGPEDTLTCPATTTVDGKVFKNYDDYPAARLGDISLRTAFANSCNTAFIGARDLLGDDDLAEAAHSLGLGLDHDLGFPAYLGQVPRAAGETERAAGMIGQGKVLASPMAMAGVAASVAAGHTVLPHLVDGYTARSSANLPLTGAEAKELRSLMRSVVTEGSGRSLAGLGEVGAKTGTAEYGSADKSGSLPTHAWMVATRGDLAVAVFVETGASGSGTAGPVLSRFLR